MAIRKYYLLMLLGMAANMLVVNDAKAAAYAAAPPMNNENQNANHNHENENQNYNPNHGNENQNANPNQANVNQNYNPNQANVNQNDNHNHVNVNQNDNHNHVNMNQNTNHNHVNVNQNDNPNQANVDQNANGKADNVFERLEHPVIIKFIKYHTAHINFITTLVFSATMNYFNIFKYKEGRYSEIINYGWRSKRFLNKHLQFDIIFTNVTCLIWGVFYLIPNMIWDTEKYKPLCHHLWMFLILLNLEVPKVPFLFSICKWTYLYLREMAGVHLLIHFTESFSIAIGLDSLVWIIVDKIIENHINANKPQA